MPLSGGLWNSTEAGIIPALSYYLALMTRSDTNERLVNK